MITVTLLILLGSVSNIFCSRVQPFSLKVEHLPRPTAVDNPNPRLSWILKVNPSENRIILKDVKQTAYQICVATSIKILQNDTGDLWDTGKVKSDDSINIRYEGKKLKPSEKVFWRVRIWDQNDVVTNYSRVRMNVLMYFRPNYINFRPVLGPTL